MLYPKPIGFKFYRDSVRFIGVLAGIAGLGFCFSAVQFVRIGVCLLSFVTLAYIDFNSLNGTQLSFAHWI
jgi:cation-transporting ATPase 13A3/4/5